MKYDSKAMAFGNPNGTNGYSFFMIIYTKTNHKNENHPVLAPGKNYMRGNIGRVLNPEHLRLQ